MREARHCVFPAEGLVKQVMQRQRRKPLLSADYLADLHQVVVDYVCKVVCGQFVGPFPEYFVVQGIGIHLNVAADHIVHLHHGVLRHLEADCPVSGVLQQVLHVLRRQAQGVAHTRARDAVIGECLAVHLLLRPCGLQFLRSVECVVGGAFGNQLFGIFAIYAFALGLPVRRVRIPLIRGLHYLSGSVNALVGVDAAPAERLYDVLLRTRHEAVGVSILYTEDEVSSVLLGVQIVI